MISSAALPKEAFNRPPIPSPRLSASCSVASPINPASGTIPRHEAPKTKTPAAWVKWRMTARGTNTSRILSVFPALHSRRVHNGSLLTAHALLARTDLKQVFESIDAGIVTIGPIDAEGVGAHQRHAPGAD